MSMASPSFLNEKFGRDATKRRSNDRIGRSYVHRKDQMTWSLLILSNHATAMKIDATMMSSYHPSTCCVQYTQVIDTPN
jgi:hypothetical protein